MRSKYKTKIEKSLFKRGCAARNTEEEYVNYCKNLPGADISKEIDRIDNEKHYEVGNLRWVTSSENKLNTRRNKYIQYKEGQINVSEFTEKYTKLTVTTVTRLLRQGMSPEDIINYERTVPGGRPSSRV